MKIKQTVTSILTEAIPVMAVFGVIGVTVFFAKKTLDKINIDLSIDEDKWNFRK